MKLFSEKLYRYIHFLIHLFHFSLEENMSTNNPKDLYTTNFQSSKSMQKYTGFCNGELYSDIYDKIYRLKSNNSSGNFKTLCF